VSIKSFPNANHLIPGQAIACRIKRRIAFYDGYFVEVDNLETGAFLDSTSDFQLGQTIPAYFVCVVNNVVMLTEHEMGPENFAPPDDPFNPDPSRVPKKPYPTRGELSVALAEPEVQVD
jgi:hypothetical protein